MNLRIEDLERIKKIECLVHGLYDVMNPFPNHSIPCRGIQGSAYGLDGTLALLETLDKDLKNGSITISFPHDRYAYPKGVQG
jgi:hypothetical protein